ncbi:hypothetical protein MPSEU_000405100 [Mayamaea pseudoterrestris]|nr:hypothetical protein MPSEU_000405100 [Mayamaea pseudoterrestris]
MAIINNNMRKNSIDQSLISNPTSTDILCGKDKTFARHQGNAVFRDMIVSYAPVYAKVVTKQSKMQVTKEIVTTLQQKYNARFLQPSRCGQGWNEISDQVARDKTSHALRFAAKSSGACSNTSASIQGVRKSLAAATYSSSKKSHRRQVSWNVLDGSSAQPSLRTRSPSPLVTRSNSITLLPEDLEPIDWKQTTAANTTEPFIFERQQLILKNMGEYNVQQHHPFAYPGPVVMSRHDFDSLRSEDFESLMNDPTLLNAVGEIPDEWVTVPL